jgi:hypothetical protein
VRRRGPARAMAEGGVAVHVLAVTDDDGTDGLAGAVPRSPTQMHKRYPLVGLGLV